MVLAHYCCRSPIPIVFVHSLYLVMNNLHCEGEDEESENDFTQPQRLHPLLCSVYSCVYCFAVLRRTILGMKVTMKKTTVMQWIEGSGVVVSPTHKGCIPFGFHMLVDSHCFTGMQNAGKHPSVVCNS